MEAVGAAIAVGLVLVILLAPFLWAPITVIVRYFRDRRHS